MCKVTFFCSYIPMDEYGKGSSCSDLFLMEICVWSIQKQGENSFELFPPCSLYNITKSILPIL